MVLRGKPVGEQGAADRWTAFHRGEGPGGAIPRGPFPFLGRLPGPPLCFSLTLCLRFCALHALPYVYASPLVRYGYNR